jgi:UDP-2-acetamido-2-deoxy-ribo-hexuluronate aminotransferase
MREIRVHGQESRYYHTRVGVGGRMDTLQCAIVLAKFERFAWEVAERGRIGRLYDRKFQSLPAPARSVAIRPDRTSVYAQYTLIVPHRDQVAERLKAAGIPTAIHYPRPLNEQPAYRALCCPDCTPVSSGLARQVISLPMHPDLRESDQDRVVEAVLSALVEERVASA